MVRPFPFWRLLECNINSQLHSAGVVCTSTCLMFVLLCLKPCREIEIKNAGRLRCSFPFPYSTPEFPYCSNFLFSFRFQPGALRLVLPLPPCSVVLPPRSLVMVPRRPWRKMLWNKSELDWPTKRNWNRSTVVTLTPRRSMRCGSGSRSRSRLVFPSASFLLWRTCSLENTIMPLMGHFLTTWRFALRHSLGNAMTAPSLTQRAGRLAKLRKLSATKHADDSWGEEGRRGNQGR